MKSLTQAIAANRYRHARYAKYEKILRQLRQRVFDYADRGPEIEAKADRLIAKCKAILKPLWKAQHEAREFARQNRTMHSWT